MTAAFRYPAPLRPGSRIAVMAPSSGVEPALHPRLDLVIAHLRGQGFVVEEGQCLRAELHSASAPAPQRAAEWMQLLLRDDIAAILPPWGGELAIELLERMDWTALRAARPKWLMGYSDLSTLMLPITLRLGWATAHGLNLMDLCPAQQDSLSAQANAALRLAPGERFMQRQSERWQLKWTDFAADPHSAFNLTEPTAWRCLNRPESAAVQLEGRLIGGCLDTLVHLVGTPYGELPQWLSRHPGAIVYLENCEFAPAGVLRALTQMRLAGWFDGIGALLLGRSSGSDAAHAADTKALSYRAAVRQATAALPCPVLVDVDIGHRPPQLTLINGASARVTWSEALGGEIEQVLD